MDRLGPDPLPPRESAFRGIWIVLAASGLTNLLMVPYSLWLGSSTMGTFGAFVSLLIVPAVVYGLFIFWFGVRYRLPEAAWLLVGLAFSYAYFVGSLLVWELFYH